MFARHCQTDDDFRGWVKTTVLCLAVSGPKFRTFWDDVGDHRSFQHPFPIVCVMFLTGDIGPQSCLWVAKSSKI